MIWDLPALLSIRQEGVLWTFIALKKSIALAGFEPANFWSSGKHTNHYTTKATQHTVYIMEAVTDDHIPFVDIEVCRRPDGSLGHGVYRKRTHTNLYLHAIYHHRMAYK
jgi:hypothetical protein